MRQRTFTTDRTKRVIRHTGPKDQAMIRFTWPTTDDSDPARAIGLQLLFGIPLVWGCLITVADVLAVLWLQHRGFRYLEAIVGALVLTIGLCFGVELLLARPAWGEVAAGFVPRAMAKRFPTEPIQQMGGWAGFPEDAHSTILMPTSGLYERIGSAYIREWQKVFGPAKFYLADSFNEMQVPVPADRDGRLETLAKFGQAVYGAIKAGRSDATWVMQGWLFYKIVMKKRRKTLKVTYCLKFLRGSTRY